MFTGLVEGLGTVREVAAEQDGRLLVIAPPAAMWTDGCAIGDSVAINGCCLTVIAIGDGTWSFQAGPETLKKTNLGRLSAGQLVNLERALLATARLGGHFVQGHVDGVGVVDNISRTGESAEWVTLWFRVGVELARQMVSKGSVAVDGVSLTVVDVTVDRFSVALIPHTLQVTTLGQRQVGDEVNIETDLLAKYVQKLLGTEPVL